MKKNKKMKMKHLMELKFREQMVFNSHKPLKEKESCLTVTYKSQN